MRDHSSRTHPPLLNKPGVGNWVEAEGGLPSYMERIAKHVQNDSGYTLSHAIATAVSQTRKRAAKGNPEAIKALAQWERMKAARKAKRKVAATVVGWSAVGLSRVLAAVNPRKR